MAKYKVLQKFRNVETNEVYTVGQEVELTVKRAEEAISNLKEHNGEFLERIDNKPEDPPVDDGEDEQESEEVNEEGGE